MNDNLDQLKKEVTKFVADWGAEDTGFDITGPEILELIERCRESESYADRLVSHIAEQTHEVGISDTMTPEERVTDLVARCRKAEETFDEDDYSGEAGLAVELVQKNQRIAELEAALREVLADSEFLTSQEIPNLPIGLHERIRALLGESDE